MNQNQKQQSLSTNPTFPIMSFDQIQSTAAATLTTSTTSNLTNAIDTALTKQYQDMNKNMTNKRSVLLHADLNPRQFDIVKAAYPQFDIDLVRSGRNAHSVANALRSLEQTTFLRRYPRHTKIIDVGGNPVPYFLMGVTNVVSYKPILDARDAGRYTKQMRSIRNACLDTATNAKSETTSARQRWVDDFQHFVRPIKAEDCSYHADVAFFLHSLYDISLETLCTILSRHKIQIAEAVIMYHPDIIVTAAQTPAEGLISEQNCLWHTYIDKRDNIKKISFTFLDDESLNYVHDFSQYFSLITSVTIRNHKNMYIIERSYDTGRCLMQISDASSAIHLDSHLSFNIWHPTPRGHVLVPCLEHINQAADKSTSYEVRLVDVELTLLERLTAYAMTLKDERRKPEELLMYFRTVSARTTVNGTDVTVSSFYSARDMAALCTVAWYRAYIYTYSMDKVTRQLRTYTTNIRNLSENTVPHLLRLRAQLAIAPLVGLPEFSIDGIFEKIKTALCNNLSSTIADIKNIHLLDSVNNDGYTTIESHYRGIASFHNIPDSHLLDPATIQAIRQDKFDTDNTRIRNAMDVAAAATRLHPIDTPEHANAQTTLRILTRELIKHDPSYIAGSIWSQNEAHERNLDRFAPLHTTITTTSLNQTDGGATREANTTRPPTIPGDGNCGYHCISAYVGDTPDVIRTKVAEHMRSNAPSLVPDELREITATDALAGVNKNKITSSMWCNELVIISASEIYDCTFSVTSLTVGGSYHSGQHFGTKGDIYHFSHQNNHFTISDDDWARSRHTADTTASIVAEPTVAKTYPTLPLLTPADDTDSLDFDYDMAPTFTSAPTDAQAATSPQPIVDAADTTSSLPLPSHHTTPTPQTPPLDTIPDLTITTTTPTPLSDHDIPATTPTSPQLTLTAPTLSHTPPHPSPSVHIPTADIESQERPKRSFWQHTALPSAVAIIFIVVLANYITFGDNTITPPPTNDNTCAQFLPEEYCTFATYETPIKMAIDGVLGPSIARYAYLVLDLALFPVKRSVSVRNVFACVFFTFFTMIFGIKGDLILTLCLWTVKTYIHKNTRITDYLLTALLHYFTKTDTYIAPHLHTRMPGEYEPDEHTNLDVTTMHHILNSNVDGYWYTFISQHLARFGHLTPVQNQATQAYPMHYTIRNPPAPIQPNLPNLTRHVTNETTKTDKPTILRRLETSTRHDVMRYIQPTDQPGIDKQTRRNNAITDFRNYVHTEFTAYAYEFHQIHMYSRYNHEVPTSMSNIKTSRFTGLTILRRVAENTYASTDSTLPTILCVFDPTAPNDNPRITDRDGRPTTGNLVMTEKNFKRSDGSFVVTVTSSADVLYTSLDLSEFTTGHLFNILRTSTRTLTDPRRNFINHAGVAACGKTHQIATTVLPGDIVLATTRSSLFELEKIMSENSHICTAWSDIHAHTVASYTIARSFPKSGTLHVDEAIMLHPGQLYYLAEKAQAHTIHAYADPLQLTFIPRVQPWDEKTTPPFEFDTIHTNFVSRVTPIDAVVMNRDPSLGGYGNKYTTLSTVVNSISVDPLASDTDTTRIPKDQPNTIILTMTRACKATLVGRGFKNVFTVGQSQGTRADHVHLVRLDRILPTNLSENGPQHIVATTRHRKTFTYHYLKGIEKPDRTLRAIIDLQSISDIKKEHDNPTRLFVTPDAYRMYGGYLPEPATPTDTPPQTKERYSATKVFSNFFNYMSRSLFSPWTNVTTPTTTVPAPSDHSLTYTNLRNLIQEAYDDLLPGNADDTGVFDNAVREYDPIDVTVDGYFRTNFGTPNHNRVPPAFAPRICTDLQPPRPISIRNCLHALNKRNMAAYKNRDNVTHSLPMAILHHMFDCYFVDDYQSLLDQYSSEPLVPRFDLLADFINAQTPNTVRRLLGTDIDFANFDMCKYTMILKRTVKPADERGANLKWSQPQVVIFMEKFINAVFGPIIREAFNRLITLTDPKIMINKGKTPMEMQQHAQTFMPTSSHYQFLENDFKAYDKTQDNIALEIELHFLKLLGVPEDMIEMWRSGHVYTRATCRETGFLLLTTFQRKSGDVTTSFGNTLINMVGTAQAYFQNHNDAKHKLRCAFFLGDDSLFSLHNSYDFDAARGSGSDILNRRLNLQAKTLTTPTGYFCGFYFTPTTDGVLIFCDPLRRISKLGRWDIRKDEDFEQHYISLQDNLLNYGNTANEEQLLTAIARREYALHGKIRTTGYGLAISALHTLKNNKENFRSLWDDKLSPMDF
uniref:Replicase large subunit n=1 Tax=Leucocoprinus tobamovirus A TaxID=2592766 RepID=A0A7G3KJP9_9VIRU|nr:putative RdRp [Leucocoprinus tobamovirus A]